MRATSPSRTATHGAELTFETIVQGEYAPPRVRPFERTLLRVIAGIVVLTQRGEDRLMGAGDEAIVEAGVTYRLASACGDSRVVMGLRPAA
jgi:mannose-6-phosphate isomerase-like protein (cupin superfamily)